MPIRICGFGASGERTEFSPVCAQTHPDLLYPGKELPLKRKSRRAQVDHRALNIACLALNAACIALSLLILGWLMR